MLIEELIRLGRPLLQSGLEPQELLSLITDADDDRTKNFYRHVLVVELSPEGTQDTVSVLPIQNWQVEQPNSENKKVDIYVDVKRALGAPIAIPPGGDPTKPQGCYGQPVYPIYDLHFQEFANNAEAVVKFLQGRLERTPNFRLNESQIREVAKQVHEAVSPQYDGNEKWLGVLVLARCEPGGFYHYSNHNSLTHVGRSRLMLDQYLEPDSNQIANAIWGARVAEGADKGRRDGPCSIAGTGDEVVSAYCKAWPWAFPTWTCPVPKAGDIDLLVEGIGLAEPSYRALTLGANLFHAMTRRLHHVVLPELFAPVENRDRNNSARSRSKLPDIFGSALLLPLDDALLSDSTNRNEFALRIIEMLKASTPPEPLADRYLTAVTGFDVILPEEFHRDDFYLTLVYFSGDTSRGDIHLRAYIQDVLPSTAASLKKLVHPCREMMAELLQVMSPNSSEKQRAYLSICFQSVPYLLARGYGGSHLWTLLEQCFHRRPLDVQPVMAHVAARIRSAIPRWPDSRFDVIDEVIFLLVCQDFIHRYNRAVARPPKEDPMPMRPWRELIEMLEKNPPSEIKIHSVAELGFASGVLVRRFSSWYWKATKAGEKGKDYLKHRVLTFGADLSPEVVWRVALGKLCDVAARYEKDKHSLGRNFRERLGIILTELEQRSEHLRSCRDEFMTAFWAGYCLQGYDRPRKTKVTTADSKGGEG